MGRGKVDLNLRSQVEKMGKMSEPVFNTQWPMGTEIFFLHFLCLSTTQIIVHKIHKIFLFILPPIQQSKISYVKKWRSICSPCTPQVTPMLVYSESEAITKHCTLWTHSWDSYKIAIDSHDN